MAPTEHMLRSSNPPPESSDPETPEPPDGPRQGNSKRPDRQPSNNLFWYMMGALLLGAVIFAVVQNDNKREKLSFGKFTSGMEGSEATWDKTNVFELTINDDYILFQDQPESNASDSSPTASTIKYYRIPAYGIDEDKQKLTALLDKKSIDYNFGSPPLEWLSVAYFAFLSLICLFFFVFVFRRMGGAGSAMAFGRSRGKLYAQEDVEITFSDAAGIEEAVEELREVVEFLRTPGKYQALGGRIPRGVLLVGPPGTGKTLLAKAVAGESGVPFFSLSGSDFVEMFVGVGAARVRDMFQQAGQRSPSIIFIDELDALGKVRGSGMPGGHDEREQTLNALLVEMDGFSSDQSVIVMAATNIPETLDPALLRPGRFDRHVLVDRPDIKGREAILKVHAAKIRMDDDVDLKRVAKLTPGFVGADLANLVNEAALMAARRDKKKVTTEEFEDGIERIVAGLEKQTRVIHEDEKLRVAYHECGHALVACSLPHTDPVHKISIIPRGMGALGYTLQFPENDRQLHTQSELENRICVLLGGIVAEENVFKEISTGAHNDLQRATGIARRMVTEFGMSPKLGRVNYAESQTSPFPRGPNGSSDQVHSENTVREIDLEVRRIIDESSKIVQDILSDRHEVLEHMSRELMESETMDAEHLKRILDQYKTSPQISPGTRAASPEGSPGNLGAGADASDLGSGRGDSPSRESADGA